MSLGGFAAENRIVLMVHSHFVLAHSASLTLFSSG
jgi:hypothetical protein